ncbi:glycosylinositol phosphorylceramide mannosyl transferase 1-like [Phragmites australis]|uniref:glycosylinositol phosphorylceramide mannosyl transferase 1-like n=1 Tax=Phragmites australis TaxID=29695 RepID=UPI002D789995|nr:glycosylinositol phosphorylceramide mannosyl transferase 1-like [Phragmites australis]
MLGMTKLLLQLQAAAAVADRRHGLGFGPARRHQLPLRHASAAATGSRFAACFVRCLLVLAAAVTTLALALTLHRPDPDPDPAASPRGFAVVINTWKRYALLRRSVAHYAACAGVDAVHVVWSEPRAPHEALRQSVLNCTRRGNVRFAINEVDSLNNRFRPIRGLTTDAVFSVDDDLIVPCSTLRFAYSVWQSAPSAMVGFVPRMHWLADPRGNTKEYRYGSWWSVWWTGTYSIVLSKASFFRRQYLDLYTNQMLPAIRNYVNENRNCEDIAMSFLVANVTGAPPIWVQGRIIEIGSSGISSLKGHDSQRSRCLNTFAAMYGHMPLVATTVKAVDGRRSWFW